MREKIKQAYDKVHAQRFVLQVIIIALAIAADQVTKAIIMANMARQQTIPVIGNVVRLTYILNEGASFGIFPGARIFFLVATAITLVVLSVYMVKARRKQPRWLRVCLSLIFAGAAGNFIDRLFINAVVNGELKKGLVRDFIDLSGMYFPWIFNVADACLVVGSIMLAIYLLFIYKEKDGKPLLARHGRKDELLEEDEKIAGEEEESQKDKAEKEQG